MSSSVSASGPHAGEAPLPRYLAGLNAAQREAVETLDGPVLMLAGAGTGKTRALTARLAHLLLTGRAVPGQIMAVTFTNKAAREMKERVAALLGRSVEGWWLGTFHSLAARFLRRHAEVAGLQPNFTILDPDDQLRLMKQILAAEGIDDKSWPARAVLGAVERWKDKGLTPDRVSAGEAGAVANGRGLELYAAYQARLKQLNACDFGDLLLHCIEIFRTRQDILDEVHRQFRYLLVDEYQDTNVAQYLWLRLIAQGHKNICCVGDDDQSIYGWRGAEVGNILRFEQDFPGAKVIRLERNYRSTPTILGAASGLIAKNEGRLGKTLWTEGGEAGEGERIRVRGLWDGEAEARFVGEEIEALQRNGESLAGMAILLRTTAQMREFEDRFNAIGLPHRIVGGPRFYERLEVRDALAYLRVVAQPADDLAFERIVNKPKRGLGDATLKQFRQVARAQGLPLLETARRLIATDELKPKARKALADVVENFLRWRQAAEDLPHTDLAETVLEESGYTDMWRDDTAIEAPGRLENLAALIDGMADFENLQGFLEHVGLVMESLQDTGGEQVSIMTLHAAKGLEFDTVFLAGWEEGLFPNQRALDDTGLRGLEEERRLAYVGLTRARRRLFVTFAANRRLHGSWAAAIPSRFVDELPPEHVEVESEQGLYGQATAAWGGSFGRFGAAEEDDPFGPRRASPGMTRAQRYAESSKPFIDGTATVVKSLSPAGGFAAGERVFHTKFGYGAILRTEGEKLTVDFDHSGEKRVMAAFLVPADQAG
ncbi:ATP-dependent helicase [Algihabitans albus]|uniref:ATP-dependent helicase n=1 Tax=Algihabitans albus TaxID=2164067 RepID=UPI000E5D3A4F|nr:UvrD-helicase domain-containing protein [Algihabitans albus]